VAFWLAGSKAPYVPNDNTVTVTLGDQSVATLFLPYLEPWHQYSFDVTFSEQTIGRLSSQNGGTDWAGALLDRVELTERAVPDPASTLLLLGMGVTGLVAAKRRWR
jgi:hypothetical protein